MTERAGASLTPEEQASVLEIQDRMIKLLVDRDRARELGESGRADALGREIQELMRERDGIEMWALAK